MTRKGNRDNIVTINDVNEQIVHFLHDYHTTKAITSNMHVTERPFRRHLNNITKRNIIKVVAVPIPVLYGFRAWSKLGNKVNPSHLNNLVNTLAGHPLVYSATCIEGYL